MHKLRTDRVTLEMNINPFYISIFYFMYVYKYIYMQNFKIKEHCSRDKNMKKKSLISFER